MKLAAVTLVLGILTPQAPAQQPAVKSVTTGVVLDVIAVDSKGNPILDLAADEFEVSEDGVRQRIISATLVQRGVVRPLKSASVAGAAQTVATPAGVSAPQTSEPAPALQPTVTAIVFDRLSPEARSIAGRAALAYVSTLAAPHDYAGVFLADLSLRTFQPFTNEREKLALAVNRLTATVPANTVGASEREPQIIQGLDPNQPVTASAESAGNSFSNIAEREHRLEEIKRFSGPGLVEWRMAEIELRMRETYQRFMAEFDSQASLAGLKAVVSSFGTLPGRKSILYFIENLPITSRNKPKFDALIGEANRANITVYPVDAAGLRVHSKEAEVGRNVAVAGAQGIGDEQRQQGAWTKELEKQEEMLSSRPTAVLGRLAKDTGGFLIENTNDLGAGVARMQQERTTYYLLAYQPTNAKLDGTFRKVSVKVKRSKVTVRARPGYLAPVQVQ